MDETPPAPWAYMNDLRFGAVFLGAAMVVFLVGMVVVIVGGAEEAAMADLLLAIGVFLLIFTVLLALPRIRSRGAASYSLLVERSMDDVEQSVRSALEEMGHKTHIEVTPSRSRRPPRLVHVDGAASRFLLRAAPYREERGKGTAWTEIVQIGIGKGSDEVARELRERIAVRLTAPPSSSE